MPLVEIKDCNTWIENKPFFDQPVKNKQEAYEKLIEMLRYLKKNDERWDTYKNDDYTWGNLLDFSNHQNYYKPTGIDLSRQTNTVQIMVYKLWCRKWNYL